MTLARLATLFQLMTTYGPIIWAAVVYVEDIRKDEGEEDRADDRSKLERALRLIVRQLVTKGVELTGGLIEDIADVIGVFVEIAHEEGLFVRRHHVLVNSAPTTLIEGGVAPEDTDDPLLEEFLRSVPER